VNEATRASLPGGIGPGRGSRDDAP
jgi:hypothetical protein